MTSPASPFTESDLTAYLEAAGLAFVSMADKIKDALDITDEEFARLRKQLEEYLDATNERGRCVQSTGRHQGGVGENKGGRA